MIRPGPCPPATVFDEVEDFSLVLGGPLFQLFRHIALSGNHLELLYRRLIIIPLIAWLPMLALSIFEGRAWGGTVKVPFLLDVDVHARLLLALPLLIVAELVVYQRMRPVVHQFLARGLIPDAARGKFDAGIASARRWRNSVIAEVLLIAIVLLVGGTFFRRVFGVGNVDTWYADATGAGLRLTVAGLWYRDFSFPLFQFILLRWYYRLFIWARFLWGVARINLSLVPTHPDRAGGLGFLTGTVFAFVPLLWAQGVLLAGTLANRIFFMGAKLPDFKVTIIGVVAWAVFMTVAPLLVFSVRLERARRVGTREYGALAARYVRGFDQKWLRGGAPAGEELIGNADIQSLADMGNSFAFVREMTLVPFTLRTVWQLAVITLVPVVPLALTMMPLEEFLNQILKVVF